MFSLDVGEPAPSQVQDEALHVWLHDGGPPARSPHCHPARSRLRRSPRFRPRSPRARPARSRGGRARCPPSPSAAPAGSARHWRRPACPSRGRSARCPRGREQLGHRKARGRDARLDGGDIIVGAAGGHRILPDQILLRHVRPEVARLRPHVAVGQLEPGAGEDLREIGRIAVEPLGDGPMDRVHLHRHVCVGHDRIVADRGSSTSTGLSSSRMSIGSHCQAPAGLLRSSHS